MQQNAPRMDFPPELIWFLIGFVLIISEFALPGVLVVFFGIGAWVAALTTWLNLTPTLTSQNIIFLVSSLSVLFLLRKRMQQIFVGQSTNGEIEDEYTGKEIVALTHISDTSGKVEIKGTEWNARSQAPIEARTLVIVERREGLTLHVRSR